jgi:hypothetical protein
MKKLFLILITIIFIFNLFTIESACDFLAIPFVRFSSLENYLNAYLTVKEGGSVINFTEAGFLHESIKLTELETLHLPIRILENFVIREIFINESVMSIYFLHEDVECPTNKPWHEWSDYLHLRLRISKLHSENGMEALLHSSGQTVDDLIDGKYFMISTHNLFISFTWFSDGMRFVLDIPLRLQDTKEFKALIGDVNPQDLVRFAETRTVDLTDEEEVRNLIRFGERFQRGDISANGRVTTSDALEILRFIAGLENVIEGDERAEAAADVNGDGKIDTADALAILRAVAGVSALTDGEMTRFGISGVPATADAMRVLRVVAGLA